MEAAERGYEIAVIGRHVELTDAIRNYAKEKVAKIERFTDRVIQVTVTLEVTKLQHRCDIVMTAEATRIKVRAIGDNIYAVIDKATDRLQRKLRRYKTRLHEHHNRPLHRPLHMIDMNVNVVEMPSEIDDINDEIEEETLRKLEEEAQPHEVTKQETRFLKTLTLDEAVMKMELTTDVFLLYRSEEDGKLKVIYRRKDGNYGVLEPE